MKISEIRLMHSAAMLTASAILAAGSAFALTTEFDQAKVKEVQISNDAGDVSLKKGEGKQIKVEIGEDDECESTAELKGDVLKIKVKQKGRSGSCDAAVTISHSNPLNAKLKLGSGDVKLDSNMGDLKISAGSGNIDIGGSFSRLKANAGSGSIQVNHVSEDMKFNLGSGDFNLRAASMPEDGRMKINAGSGDIDLKFKKGLTPKIEHKSAFGSMSGNNASGNDAKSSKYRIKMATGSGDATVEYF